LPLHPHLPLQVTAVILNAVKDPEEFHPPQPPGSFQPILSRRDWCCFTVAIASSSTQKHVISTEAAHGFCERRSGEICCYPLTTEPRSLVKA
jgi:hypothetical protein